MLSVHNQWQHICSLVDYAVKNVPFYRKHLADSWTLLNPNVPFQDWHIPLLTKNDVQKHTESMISTQFLAGNLIMEFTSGSSGIPLRCFKTTQERVQAAVPLWNRRKIWHKNIFSARVINFWNTTEEFAVRENDRTLSVSPFHVNKEMLSHYVSAIESFQPAWLYSHVSILYTLARLIMYSEKPLRHNLSHVEVAGEYLDEQRRLLIESVFKVPVVNNYGCREVWTIGYECREKHLHILDENVFVEIISDGCVVPPGVEGEVVVTGLHYRAMPFIRYRLGDLGSISSDSTTCGVPGSVLVLSGGRAGKMIDVGGRLLNSSVLVRALASQIVRGGLKGVAQFQLVQKDLTSFAINIVCDLDYSSVTAHGIAEFLRHQIGLPIDLDFNYVEHITPSPSGKTPEFVSLLPDTG